MAENKDSSKSLKNRFSGNFRSGLKLPALDPQVNKSSAEDQTPSGDGDPSKSSISKSHGKKNINKLRTRSKFTPKWDGTTLLSKVEVEDDKCRKDNMKCRLVEGQSGRGDHPINDVIIIKPDKRRSKTVASNESVSEIVSERGDEEEDVSSSPDLGVGDVGKLVIKQSKGDNLETEINQRISSVYRSIENLEKKRLNFNNSIRAAERRATMSKVTASVTTVSSEVSEEGRRKSRVIDVTRTYPQMFGLDPMKVIASSEDDSDVDEDGVKDPRKKSKKSIRKYLEQFVKEEQPSRDMSAIMPTLSEKTFLTKLQKRENQLNKEINEMRNNLDVMNMKAEREAKKAQTDRNKVNFDKRPNVTKLMRAQPTKGPARELMDFLQATGGSSGGWDIKDHMTFLRGFRKWSSRPIKLVDNLCQLLSISNKTPEDIVEHIAWQEKFEKLNSANQAHIRQWQISRRREKEAVYQMASQSQKARLESEKRQQDIIRYRRAEERERNHHLLSEWKRSKTREHQIIMKEGEGKELDTTEKIAKMDLEMNKVRKEIRDITAMTKDIGKSLQSVGSADSIWDQSRQKGKVGRLVKTASASSGFCEMTIQEIEAVANELAGDGENFLRSNSMDSRHRTGSAMSSSYAHHRDPIQAAEAKRMLQEFRNRDEEMMDAKKKTILGRKKKMCNSAFLTDQQLKERMKKIAAPSKLMCPTKGWTIRKEIRDQEKIENQNRDKGDGNLWSSESKDSFNSASYVKNIPKLGMPAWRKATAR